eukprot:747962-Pyramimonas_sp.AAC.1
MDMISARLPLAASSARWNIPRAPPRNVVGLVASEEASTALSSAKPEAGGGVVVVLFFFSGHSLPQCPLMWHS